MLLKARVSFVERDRPIVLDESELYTPEKFEKDYAANEHPCSLLGFIVAHEILLVSDKFSKTT